MVALSWWGGWGLLLGYFTQERVRCGVGDPYIYDFVALHFLRKYGRFSLASTTVETGLAVFGWTLRRSFYQHFYGLAYVLAVDLARDTLL